VIDLRKILSLVFILVIINVFVFLNHEQSVAIEKRDNYEFNNSNISIFYTRFSNHLSDIRKNLVKMQDFFLSDVGMIPDLYNEYYIVLSQVKNSIVSLEEDGFRLQYFCNRLDDYSNEICLVYALDFIEVKDNYQVVVDKFNEVIVKYNDMSLSNYDVFR